MLVWGDRHALDGENPGGRAEAQLRPLFCSAPGSEAVRVARAGHLVAVQRAEEVAAAVAAFVRAWGEESL